MLAKLASYQDFDHKLEMVGRLLDASADLSELVAVIDKVPAKPRSWGLITGDLMSIHVGDFVTTDTGINAKVVSFSNDGVTAYVVLSSDGRGLHVEPFLIATLAKVESGPLPPDCT